MALPHNLILPQNRLCLTTWMWRKTSRVFGQTERGEIGAPEFKNYGGNREASFS